MGTETKQVQVRVDFITDESRRFAKTILDTKEFNAEIAKSNAILKKYQQELKAAGSDENKRSAVLAKIAAEEQKVAANLTKIAEEAKKVAGIDLSRLTPPQLKERAKQLALAMEQIPASAPLYKALEAELATVNGQISQLRANAKGAANDTDPKKGGLLGTILGVAGGVGLLSLAQNALRSLFEFGRSALQEIDSQLKADAQVRSSIESTAGVAGKSLEELKKQAEDLQKVTLFTDDQTEGAQALLLTFTNIREEVFDRTIPVLQDMSTKLGQDLNSSAIQAGKALNDPIKGITALSRVGVSFTEGQKKVIKSLVETGDIAGAQAIILGELEREFGGSAKAAAEAGLGGYQRLNNRLGEIKESFGALISGGLQRIQPFLERSIIFLEQLTERFTSGKRATGEYATAIEVVVFIFNAIAKVFQVVGIALEFQVKMWNTAGQKVGEFISAIRELPIVGELFETFIITPLRFVADAIDNLPAAWAGFVAATKQAAINIYADLQDLVLGARVFVKNIEAALTFSSSSKKKLEAEIRGLESQRATAAKAGKTIGEAYVEARDAALAKSPAAAAPGGSPVKTTADPTGSVDLEAAKKRIEERLKNELQAIEIGIQKRQLLLENERIKGLVNEQAYYDRLNQITEQGLLDKLKVYKVFHQEQTVDALKLANELAVIEQGKNLRKINIDRIAPAAAPGSVTSGNTDKTAQALALQDSAENAREKVLDKKQEERLAKKFERALVTELDYELKRLELKRQAIEEELLILESAGPGQAAAVRKKEEEKYKIEDEINKKRLENAKRTEEMKMKVEQAGLQATSDFFGVAADLLGQDEKARKKNASAIKAFQSAQVITNGTLEVQKIWASVADYGPAGPIIGAILTAVSVARAGIALNKIQNTKFALGGIAKFGFFGGRSHSQGGTKGYFEDGTAIEVEKDEAFAVVNKKNAPMLRMLSQVNAAGGNGVPFFEHGGSMRFDTGGLPAINTTPSRNVGVPPQFSQAAGNMDGFIKAVEQFGSIVANFPRRIEAVLSYLKFEEQASDLNRVRQDAST